MKSIKKIAVILTVLCLPVIALADQAAWISKADALKGEKLLKTQTEIKEFCAPCGDAAATTKTVASVEIAPVGDDYWEVRVNGEGVDLAYVYFKTKDGKWKNAAKELDIEVSDVPKYLDSED